MLTLYVSPTALSCRKARLWLEEHHISFQERNIFSTFLSPIEFHNLLQLLQKEKLSILSLFTDSSQSLSETQEKEYYAALSCCPALLNRPILVDSNQIEIGFSESGFQKFLEKKNSLI